MVEAAGIETCAASTESLWFQALSASRSGVRPECRAIRELPDGASFALLPKPFRPESLAEAIAT